jgi:hypothetical protein
MSDEPIPPKLILPAQWENKFLQDMRDLNDHIDIIDFICDWADRHGVAVQSCSEFIKKSPTLLAKMTVAAESLRFLKPVRKLQI